MQIVDRRSVVRQGFLGGIALAAAALFRREASAAPVVQPIEATLDITELINPGSPDALVLLQSPATDFITLVDYPEEQREIDVTGRPVYIGPHAGWGWLDYESASITHAWDSDRGEWSLNQ